MGRTSRGVVFLHKFIKQLKKKSKVTITKFNSSFVRSCYLVINHETFCVHSDLRYRIKLSHDNISHLFFFLNELSNAT